ncbi:MAG: glycosyltransferase family 2 protein [Bacteroidetes bacterium]|nr:glycosyltransferase family 2 protein [Bacteroidota bacterium]MCB9043134.1 glycosyltransferase family 2 protein [Chitinophagales bacterium]
MISVVIPVYNAADFLPKCVVSVFAQPAVAEVVLVDDCSQDQSVEVCQNLQQQYREYHNKSVVFLQNEQNSGVSVSRNKGIKVASQIYIAFVDADDFYFPNRFEKSLQKLAQNPTIDGVYAPVIPVFETENAAITWQNDKRPAIIDTKNKHIPPEQLFENMGPVGKNGWFHGNGLLIKKSAFQKCDYFNPNLDWGEDSLLFLQMALSCKLVHSGEEQAVAAWVQHPQASLTKRSVKVFWQQRQRLYQILYFWAAEKKVATARLQLIAEKYRHAAYKKAQVSTNSAIKRQQIFSEAMQNLSAAKTWKNYFYTVKLMLKK